MASAGNVSVDVEGRADSLPAVIQEALDSVDTTVEIEADASAAQAEVDSLDGGVIEAEVDASIDSAQAEIESLDGGTTETEVTADTSQAQSSIDALGDSLQGVVGDVGDLAGELGGGTGGGGGLLGGLGALGRVGGGAAAGVTAVGAALIPMVDAAAEAEIVSAQLDNILQTTGAGAHLTSDEVQALAGNIRDYSGFSDEAVASGATLLLTFQGVSSEAAVTSGVFDRAVTASADIARLMGGDVTGAALRLGRALDDPQRGMSALQRSGVSFTKEQRAVITALVESGDQLGAQQELLAVVEGQVGGTAAAYGSTFKGSIDRTKESIGDLGEEIGGGLLPYLTTLTSMAASGVGAITNLAFASEGWGAVLGGVIPNLQAAAEEGGNWGFAAEVLSTGPLTQMMNQGDGASKMLVDFGTAADQAAAEVNELTTDINQFMQEIFGLTNAEDAFTQAQFSMLDSLAQNGSAIEGNTLAAIANRQGLQSLVNTTAQRVNQLRSQDASEAQVAAAQREGISVINTMAARYGWTRQQTQAYTRAILDIPSGASTNVVVHGLADASSRLGNFLSTLKEFDGRTYTAYVETIGTNLTPFASGTESAPRGVALVGEEGPELIELGGGERIHSASDTARMAAAPAGVAGGTNVILVRDIDEAMAYVPPDAQGKVRRRFLAGSF